MEAGGRVAGGGERRHNTHERVGPNDSWTEEERACHLLLVVPQSESEAERRRRRWLGLTLTNASHPGPRPHRLYVGVRGGRIYLKPILARRASKC